MFTGREFRHNTYFPHFCERVAGLEFDLNGEKGWDYANDAGTTAGAAHVCIASRLHFTPPVDNKDFTFVNQLTSQTVKSTLPVPACGIS